MKFEPESQPGFFDGPVGILRAIALLAAAVLLGYGFAAIERAGRPSIVVGPQA